MSRRSIHRTFFTLLAALLVAACNQAATTPSPLIFTQTAAAQASQDAAMEALRLTAEFKLHQIPTDTRVPTATLTRTASPVPSLTSTIYFTPTRTATPLPSGTPLPTLSPYTCQLVEQTPADGTSVGINTTVTVRWTVKNVGLATWDAKDIDFLQVGGDKIARDSRIDLSKTVRPGETVELAAVLKFKDETGPYRTDWMLVQMDTATTFCPLYVNLWLTDR
jgi:hypothetical protein